MLSLTVLCAKFHKVLRKKIATVNSNLKNYIYLWSNFHKIICSRNVGLREFRTIFRVAPKSICGPLHYTTIIASGVGGGGAQVQAHPQKFWFVENPGKIPVNLNKILENMGKNGAQRCLTLKMAPNVCRKISEEHFLEVIPKNGRQKLHDNFLGKFGKIWAKILCTPKNMPAPTPMIITTFAFQHH